jgi:hypothetical protein
VSKIIDLHHEHDLVSSRMPNATGLTVRNGDLFWIPPRSNAGWIFDRLSDLVALYNSKYGFHLSADIGQAQLTRYQPGQHYDGHMDLGAHQSSLRKITVTNSA